MSALEQQIDENKLFEEIRYLIEDTQGRVWHQISHAGVMLYWHIGYRINYANILD